MVRVPTLQYHFIARVLDVGAMGVVVPLVADASQARTIVESAKYPPDGRRGSAFGVAHDDYRLGDLAEAMRLANDEVMLMAQIETRAMKWYCRVGTRTIGTRSAAREVAMSMRMVSMLHPVCSMSNTANSAPASAAIRAMPVVLNSNIIVPTARPPSRNLRFTGLIRMAAISLIAARICRPLIRRDSILIGMPTAALRKGTAFPRLSGVTRGCGRARRARRV
jgi:hypothetical protein